MGFDIDPKGFLEAAKGAHQHAANDTGDLGRAIAASVMLHHLGDHVFRAYKRRCPDKVHGQTSPEMYAMHQSARHESVALIQELCNAGKHGPARNGGAKLKGAKLGLTFIDGTPIGLTLAFTGRIQAMMVIVTTMDNRILRFSDEVAAPAVAFWQREFEQLDL